MDVVCLGELLLDMFPAETGKGFSEITSFIPVPGGAPANVAVAAARLGCRSAFIGKVGDDPFGRRLAAVLAENGVDTHGMRFDRKARTTLNFMTMPDVHTTECLFYRNPGADMMLAEEDLDRRLIETARFFHFGSVSLTEEPCRSATLGAARIAKAAGVRVSFDVNYRPTLWPAEAEAVVMIRQGLALADIVKVNEKELALLAGTQDPRAGCRAILEAGPLLCVATLGPLGSFFATRDAEEAVEGFRVNTVDATGCGDAFVAALLCRLAASLAAAGGDRALDPEALSSALTFANAAGALTATKKGVMSALPKAQEVEALLRKAGRAAK